MGINFRLQTQLLKKTYFNGTLNSATITHYKIHNSLNRTILALQNSLSGPVPNIKPQTLGPPCNVQSWGKEQGGIAAFRIGCFQCF